MKIKFKVESLRIIPCPHNRDKDPEHPQKTYIAIVNIKDLPDNIPLQTNPREQNINTKVAKKIKNSLLTDVDYNFHLLNRGLLLSAESVKFNNDTNMLSLDFSNLEKHGNVDGGHTYRIIMENKHQLEGDQFVRLEIMTGVEDFFEDLASARNTSVQVEDKSIAKLQKKFDIIEKALEGASYYNNIAYKENEDKDIDIADIVAVLTMFNIDRFSPKTHPVISYSSKKKCIDYYLEDYEKPVNPFMKMTDIVTDIFELYDYIEVNFPVVYNDYGGHYGKIKGVTYKDGKAIHKRLFSDGGKTMAHGSPKGFIYPVLGAFRALVEEDKLTKKYKWSNKVNPKNYFDQLAFELVVGTVDRSRTLGSNPQSVGKDSGHWMAMYNIVQTKFLQDMIVSLRKPS